MALVRYVLFSISRFDGLFFLYVPSIVSVCAPRLPAVVFFLSSLCFCSRWLFGFWLGVEQRWWSTCSIFRSFILFIHSSSATCSHTIHQPLYLVLFHSFYFHCPFSLAIAVVKYNMLTHAFPLYQHELPLGPGPGVVVGDSHKLSLHLPLYISTTSIAPQPPILIVASEAGPLPKH